MEWKTIKLLQKKLTQYVKKGATCDYETKISTIKF